MSGRFESIDVQVGMRLLDARLAAGLTIDALAKQAGLPVRHIIRLERGETRADAKTLSHLACVLGIEIRELFTQCRNMQYQGADQFIFAAKGNPTMIALLKAARADHYKRRVA